MEGNLRFKIDWASLIVGSKFNVFSFVLLCIREQFSKYKPPGGLYLKERFNGGFFTDLFCFECAHFKVLCFLSSRIIESMLSWHMQTLQ